MARKGYGQGTLGYPPEWVELVVWFMIHVVSPMIKRRELEYVRIDGVPCLKAGPRFNR